MASVPFVGSRGRCRRAAFAVHRWGGRAAECQWGILRRPEARRSDSQESIAATRRAIGANALGDTRLAARVAAPQDVEGSMAKTAIGTTIRGPRNIRSEERRVGKECRSRVGPENYDEK